MVIDVRRQVSLRHAEQPIAYSDDGSILVFATAMKHDASNVVDGSRHSDGPVLHAPDWGRILRMPEAGIFLLGLACIAAITIWVSVVLGASPRKSAAMLAVVFTHLTTGRMSGVAMAVGSDSDLAVSFSRWEIVLLGSLVEGAVVCTFFSAFCLSVKKLIHLPWLTGAIANVHRSAESQRTRVHKWGVAGLLLFVWFPFLMTGPVVGSVIGFLLGMRPWVTVAVVMAGTISAIISWTFVIDSVAGWAERIGDFVPMLLVLLIITFVAAFRIKRYREGQARRQQVQRMRGEGQ